MENIQQEFLIETVLNLENLSLKLATELFNEELLRETFRAFHTIKGTSQTFNFNIAGKLAHELENLLYAAQIKQIQIDEEFTALLQEGTEILCETLRQTYKGKENHFPTELTQKLRAIIPNYAAAESADRLGDIPREVFNKLSIQERKILSAALAEGKEFYAIEIEFNLLDFAEKFRSLREELQKDSEIIGTFPKTDVSGADKIGFRLYFASHWNRKKAAEILKPFGAELITADSAKEFTNDAHDFLKQAVLTGKKAAWRLKKDIEFETVIDDSKISDRNSRLISECLLHLVRNAVDHAIEKSGRIKIETAANKDNVILRVSDNGRGLDAEKIRAKAIERNLIAADKELTAEETFELIFTHGFSTAEKISEISGRGVGLDVVQENIKKMNGKIRIESILGKGTIFEVTLPREA